MTDAILRGPKDRVLGPIARMTPRGVHPIAITLVAFIPGIAAAVAAANGREALAVALWLLNRVLDGLDGTVARQRERQSDLGAYLDILMDIVVYAAVPIGIAVAIDTRGAWIAVAVLLGTFYVNTISWAYLAAILERRAATADRTDRMTAVVMPGGLIEGAETIVLFGVMLVAPAWAETLFWVMAAAVAVTVGQRVVWALKNV